MNTSKHGIGLIANFLACWVVGALIPIGFANASAGAFLHPVFLFILPFSAIQFETDLGAKVVLAICLVVSLTPFSLLTAWILHQKNRVLLVLLHISIVGYCALGSFVTYVFASMD